MCLPLLPPPPQLLVLHTGRMVPERLHSASRILADALQRPSFPRARLKGAGGRPGGRPRQPADGEALEGAAAPGLEVVAVQERPLAAAQQSEASGRAVLVSLELAEQLVQQAGGHMHITYPFNMVNAETGLLDVSTAVELWLPGVH
jgi:hypothetical protein